MTLLETSLNQIKSDMLQMWNLVAGQLEKSRLALINGDKDLAKEVRANEKRVDAFELKIDMDCENIIMLQNPVAVDLRFLLSVLKINYNLERIGDYANSIAKTVEKSEKVWPEEYVEQNRIHEMFFIVQSMLQDTLRIFDKGDRKLIKGIFGKDEKLDKLNEEVPAIISGFIRQNPDDTLLLLGILNIIRKLERAGDHLTNITEELIFYFDAINVKHSKIKTKTIPK